MTSVSPKPDPAAAADRTIEIDDAKKPDGDEKAADTPPEPNAAATVQPTPLAPTLVTLFAALAGGGGGATAADGSGTTEAETGTIAATGGRMPGAVAAGRAVGASGAAAAGPVPAASTGPAAAPQPGAGPAAGTGTAAIAEADGSKPRAEAVDGAAKPDFLAALDANQAVSGQDTVAAPTTGAAPSATHAASSTAPATSTPSAAASQAAAPPVPLGQVPMTIGLRSLQGSSEFQIRLDPAELGRIEVKLEIDKARGTVMTHLVVDRADTLQMLQRDAGQLQQALSQAGLDASGGVGLSLRGDGGAQDGSRQGGENRQGGGAWTADSTDAVPEAAPMRVLRGTGGLDIRI